MQGSAAALAQQLAPQQDETSGDCRWVLLVGSSDCARAGRSPSWGISPLPFHALVLLVEDVQPGTGSYNANHHHNHEVEEEEKHREAPLGYSSLELEA